MSSVNGHSKSHRTCWQKNFVKLLPRIERLLRRVFHHLEGEKRDEAIQCAIVLCLLSYMRLHERGRAGSVTASNLVWYAVLAVKAGRPACGRMRVRDPLSEYAQIRGRFCVERLHTYGASEGGWIEDVVEDQRAAIPDVVATRMDARAWLGSLCRRTRRIATDLAKGFSTSEVACKHQVSASRISQIRRELEISWNEFQGELVPAGQ